MSELMLHNTIKPSTYPSFPPNAMHYKCTPSISHFKTMMSFTLFACHEEEATKVHQVVLLILNNSELERSLSITEFTHMEILCSTARPFQFLSILCFCFLLLVFVLCPFSCNGLSLDFYSFSCPTVEYMVRDAVRQAADSDPDIPGKLLRLFFHDCFVEGCDGSVLIEGNGTERADPANTSLGGFQVIDSAKSSLEMFCPSTVSCADILALAARDAVFLAGGPSVQIPTGRKDGRISDIANVRPNIVDTGFTLDQMLNIFAAKGLSLEDLVVLSGAHTIGSAHCRAFSDRFKMDSKGNLTSIDSTLNKTYAQQLAGRCFHTPTAENAASTMVHCDPQTFSLFDNQYYKNLMDRKGLFQTDSVLFEDVRTRRLVEELAGDGNEFLQRWEESFVKLSMVGVKEEDDDGEVRQRCWKMNDLM